MIQRLRWWLIRKLVGRSGVLMNAYIEVGGWHPLRGRKIEITLPPGIVAGNHISGEFTTEINEEGFVRMM